MRAAFNVVITAFMIGLSSSATSWANAQWQDQRVAFFGVAFIDSSLEGELRGGPSDEEVARIDMIEQHLDAALRQRGLVLADLAPVEGELVRTRNPAQCNGCELRMARQVDARYAVVAEVQKISNLLMKMNIQIRDAQTGAVVRGRIADFRANTDQSWMRAMDNLLRNAIFADGDD